MGRGLCKTILGAQLDLPPAQIDLVIDAKGRPMLDHADGPWFNLTHSGSIIALATAPSPEIGIDTEQENAEVVQDLVATVCSPEERTAIETAAKPEATRLFFTLWSLKEAYMKATGEGLGLDPKDCAFDPENLPAPRMLARLPETGAINPADWVFRLWRPKPHQSIALAYRPSEGEAWAIRDPVLANDLLRTTLDAANHTMGHP